MGRARKKITWQKIRELLIAITNDKGIVIKEARPIAEELNISYASMLSYIVKIGDKVFNGRSEPHINEKSKEFYKKYNEFDFQNARSLRGYKKKKDLKPIQAEIQFEKPHPINNILGISAEHTIQNVNMNQIYELNKKMEKLNDEMTILRTEITMLRNDFLNKTKSVHRFIRDWNGDNNNVN